MIAIHTTTERIMYKGKETFTPCPKVVLDSFFGISITPELVSTWGYDTAIVDMKTIANHMEHGAITVELRITVPMPNESIVLNGPPITPYIVQELWFNVRPTTPTKVVTWTPPHECITPEHKLHAMPVPTYEQYVALETVTARLRGIIRTQYATMFPLFKGQITGTFYRYDLLLLLDAGYSWTIGDCVTYPYAMPYGVPEPHTWDSDTPLREWSDAYPQRSVELPLKGFMI